MHAAQIPVRRTNGRAVYRGSRNTSLPDFSKDIENALTCPQIFIKLKST